MQITLEIPEELATALTRLGQDPARAVLESLGLETYRQGNMTGYQLRKVLGIPSRYEFDGFLKAHQVYDYTIEDFDKDLARTEERAKAVSARGLVRS